jgi:cellulose biosynthesis protein BcsQ
LGRVIVISSSEASEGRTTTAHNLSALLVDAEARVRLVSVGGAVPAAADENRQSRRTAESDRLDRVHAVDRGALDATLADRSSCDWIVVDAPALSGALGRATLEAADLVVVVAREGPECATSVARTMNAILDCKSDRNPGLEVLGVLVTMAARTLRTFESTLRQLYASFPFPILPYCVPLDAGLGNGGDGDSVLVAPWTRRARAYVELTMEVLHHG